MLCETREIAFECDTNAAGVIEVDEARMPRIFDFFYRADPRGSAHGRLGSGLGLPLVQRIVQAHQGVIEVTSRLGEGTTVTIRLLTRAT